jgi:hypothetical protein
VRRIKAFSFRHIDTVKFIPDYTNNTLPHEKGTTETAEFVFREAKKSRLQSESNAQPLKGEQQKAQPGRVTSRTYEKPNEGIFLRLNTRTKPIGRTRSGLNGLSRDK